MDEKHLRKVLKKFRKYNSKKATDENVSDLEVSYFYLLFQKCLHFFKYFVTAIIHDMMNKI